jgi:hypothetical protein
MKIKVILEQSYRYEVIDWYLSDSRKAPLTHKSFDTPVHVRGTVTGGENSGKIITTSQIVSFSTANSGVYIITTESGSQYVLKLENINKKYKEILDKEAIPSLLNRLLKQD